MQTQGRGASKALILGAAALALLLAAFGARLWLFSRPATVPALLEGLGESRGEENQRAFVARLKERFPIGSSERALVAELRREGFDIREGGPAGGSGAALDRRPSFADRCRRGANVHWTAVGDRVTEISGGYYTYC